MLIFPAIDMRNGRCVRLFRGDYNQETVYGDSPADQAAVWEREGAPLIHLVDLDGAKAGYPVNVASIQAICRRVSIPCELGGGIRNEKDAELVRKDWGAELNGLGNLVLLESTINRSISNRAERKSEAYRKSKFVSVQELADYVESWTKDAAIARREQNTESIKKFILD